MNDTTAPVAQEATKTKTTIRPDLSRYVTAKSGKGKRTHRTDDFVARILDGKSLEDVAAGCEKLGIANKWTGLNNGQQRMLLGNALRLRLRNTKEPLSEDAVIAVFGQPAEPYDAEKAAAAKAEAERVKAEKAAAKKEAAEKKAAAKAEGGEAAAPEAEKPKKAGKSK